MKLTGASIGPALDRPDPDRRFYLLHGPDEAGSRALGARLLAALGAEKFAISAASVRDDPASLADEAGAMALFGGPRALWIEPAGDEIVDGVAALLAAPSVESVVVAIAGALRKTSGLLKLAEADPRCAAVASYVPDERDLARLVADLGRREGLAIDPGLAERIAGDCGGNRAIVANELAKYALYLDATPDSPKTLGHDAVDALGSDSSDGDVQALGDLALDGAFAELFEAIDRAALSANDGVPLVRALQRRLLMLAPMQARIAGGERADAVMASAGRAIFWKDKALVARMLRTWPPDKLAQLLERSDRLQRALMLSDVPEVAAIGEELVAVARVAQRAR